MLTRTMLLLMGLLMAGGFAMAQTDDQLPPPAGPEVSDDTPATGSAKPEPEGYQSMESVETEDGELPPKIAPEASDDTPATGSAEPELEGYESKESVETDQ